MRSIGLFKVALPKYHNQCIYKNSLLPSLRLQRRTEASEHYRWPCEPRSLVIHIPQSSSVCISQWCLFWRVAFLSSCAATRPLILRLPCEQFNRANGLRLLSEQPHPPCELPWAIFCEQYGINHLSQHTGTGFRFFMVRGVGLEPTILCA